MAVLLEVTSRFVSAVSLGGGCAVLALRLGLAIAAASVLAGVVAAAAYVFLGRGPSTGFFSLPDAAVLYDATTGGTGLALALAEVRSEDWRSTVFEPKIPVRLRPLRAMKKAALPLTFLGAALLTPERTQEVQPSPILRRAADKVLEQAEALVSAELMKPEELEALRKELERSSARDNSTAAWEAVDAAAEGLDERIREGADNMARAIEAASAVASNPEDETARRALGDALKRLAESGTLKDDLAERFAQAMDSAASANLRELASLAEEIDRELFEAAARLCRECLGSTGLPSEAALAELAAFVEGRLARMEAVEADGIPGSGGIDRGGAGAPMLWGEPVDDEGAVFRPLGLPPGFIGSDSETVSVRFVRPEASGDTGGGQITTAADVGLGEHSAARRLSPATREVVRRYFEGRRTGGGDE